MGTNYHIRVDGEDLHIGKSSVGWAFSLRVHPLKDINSLYDWLPLMLNHSNIITDEYGREITAMEMLETITLRMREHKPQLTEDELKQNYAYVGKDNLLHHDQAATAAAGFENGTSRPGEGTWDYCDYDFC